MAAATPDLDPPPPAVDACTLASDNEIQAITGAPVRKKTPSRTISNGLSVANCYVEMPTAAESITLAVSRQAEANGVAPKAAWQGLFERDANKDREREEEGEGKHSARPERLPGLGDEAFAMPQRFGATIYVLQGNSFLRLSIGGGPADAHENKVATLRSIAELVLPKL